ncbi:PAP2 family protein [Chryseobacterium indologenes]|uniref:phosphatase PAP2 family protein n=1 Tax=Chryseobacterium indologenes TaxID=253 RepID=UPI000B51A0B2|nr:phosphatase PAP2 family protein [Chryseobacterium indologenes]ASE61279.1 PAP2 family protein [Chryseobacterium indologenes]ATN05363.1 PAP2 family protein [Chryseobacterium indologenes]AYY85878.1 phosphatase PAP2 family protein [Chryseobacterium indologenes]QIX82777.1 phosphatase PAP2 family protein [Chryseobacterium indologenes]UDQ52439.1 phosphatase PAP2 family protein [Chryseobacterium indologenes]
MKKHSQRMLIYVIVLISAAGKVNAQNNNDSIAIQQPTDSITTAAIQKNTLNYKSLIIPAAFIGYGVAGLSVRSLKEINRDTKTEVDEHRPARTRFDDYTQFIPGLMVYGLNMAGVKGKHNFRDRTIIYASSQLIVTAFTTPLKYMVKEERPDRSNRLSFPSGHAAIAFSNAQFMFREYKDTNFWLSLSGYPFAVFTGIYRIINDKHWVGDVVAGAGFGILSTELAYWLFPKIDSLLRGKNKTKTSLSSTMVMPFYQNNTVGIGLIKNF